MTYEAWTPQQIRDRVVEAAETLLASPAALGPRMTGSMADVFGQYVDDYQRGEPTRIRRIPAAGALSRMEETWTWINTFLDERGRKTLYDYGFLKSRKGMYLARYLERNGIVRRTFERQVLKACQSIADNLNRLCRVRLTAALDGVSQITEEMNPETVSSVKYASHWRAPDAKPQHLRDQLDPIDRAPALKRVG